MTKQKEKSVTFQVILTGIVLATAFAALAWRQVSAAEEPAIAPLESDLIVLPAASQRMAVNAVIAEEVIIEEDYVDWYAEIAKLLGMDVDSLWEALESGSSIADLADEKGVEVQLMIDTLVEKENAFIDKLLKKGEISEDEAAEWRAEVSAYVSDMVNADFSEMLIADYYDDGYADIAALLGIDLNALWDALGSGKSMADLAQEKGVDVQKIIDIRLAKEIEFIDQMLADESISAEEAEEWKKESLKWIEYDVYSSYVDPFLIMIKTIGVDEDTFWAAFDAGSSPADIAQEHGVDPQTVIDAVVATELATIDKEVEAGFISEEEAAEWRAEVVNYVTDMVNMGIDDFYFEEFDDADMIEPIFEDEDSDPYP